MAFPSLNDYKRCIDKNDVKRNAGDDAPEAEYQTPVLYNASTKFVKSKLQKAVDALKSVPDDVSLKKLPGSIRNDVSIEILKAERSILVSFESDEAPAPYQRKNIETSIPNDFCMVSIPQNGFLKLRFSSFLPPFQHEWYSRKAKVKDAVGQYYLDAEFDYITEAAIKAFIAQNGPINLPSEQLFLVFCRGVSPTKKTPIDSNNVYTGAITNAICRVLQHGDGWDMMSFLYTAIPTESDPYLEVILCSKTDLFHWL